MKRAIAIAAICFSLTRAYSAGAECIKETDCKETEAHRSALQTGPGGLRGWLWASQKYKGFWVMEHLHVERNGKVVIEAKGAKPFIEQWSFTSSGVAAKSRAVHGPATIQLFSLETGKVIASVDAFASDLPDWAKPFAE